MASTKFYNPLVVEKMPVPGTYRGMLETLVENYRKRAGRKAEAKLIFIMSRCGIRMAGASPSMALACCRHLGWDPSAPQNRNRPPTPRPAVTPYVPPPKSIYLAVHSFHRLNRAGIESHARPVLAPAATHVSSPETLIPARVALICCALVKTPAEEG